MANKYADSGQRAKGYADGDHDSSDSTASEPGMIWYTRTGVTSPGPIGFRAHFFPACPAFSQSLVFALKQPNTEYCRLASYLPYVGILY